VPFPAGPTSRFPGDLLLRFHRDTLGFLGACAAKHGDVFGFHIGRQPFVCVNHPDLIRDLLVTHQKNFRKGRALERGRRLLGNGLLTSEGDFHLRQRRLAQPAFHRQRIAGYATAMVDYSVRVRDRWTDGETLDVHQEMMRLTLAIVGKTLFDADVQHEAADIGRALASALDAFNLALLPFAELLEKLPLPANRRFLSARARLDETIYRIIRERRASGEDRGDLLSMLLLATDAEGDGGGMSDEQLRDEAMTLFLAGHETTANALTWSWCLLAQNPEARELMQQEVDALGRTPSFDDLPRLEYTRRVLAESMRLYPPAYAVGRRAIDAYAVGHYMLPPRTIVLASQFLQHRDARWFANPERFDPDRWTADEAAKRPKFSYFPFGAGTRICIGEQFAWTEGVLVLATLAQQWALQLAPGQRIGIQPRITLRPRHGMRMVATLRQK